MPQQAYLLVVLPYIAVVQAGSDCQRRFSFHTAPHLQPPNLFLLSTKPPVNNMRSPCTWDRLLASSATDLLYVHALPVYSSSHLGFFFSGLRWLWPIYGHMGQLARATRVLVFHVEIDAGDGSRPDRQGKARQLVVRSQCVTPLCPRLALTMHLTFFLVDRRRLGTIRSRSCIWTRVERAMGRMDVSFDVPTLTCIAS